MADGGANCRGPLVFELTLPNVRYATEQEDIVKNRHIPCERNRYELKLLIQ